MSSSQKHRTCCPESEKTGAERKCHRTHRGPSPAAFVPRKTQGEECCWEVLSYQCDWQVFRMAATAQLQAERNIVALLLHAETPAPSAARGGGHSLPPSPAAGSDQLASLAAWGCAEPCPVHVTQTSLVHSANSAPCHGAGTFLGTEEWPEAGACIMSQQRLVLRSLSITRRRGGHHEGAPSGGGASGCAGNSGWVFVAGQHWAMWAHGRLHRLPESWGQETQAGFSGKQQRPWALDGTRPASRPEKRLSEAPASAATVL